ncbi:MAG: mechanosensitive ion channel [Bacteroidetes bacterium]|nr:mechanosensitive ion channel [Bacteroidota bacterium]
MDISKYTDYAVELIMNYGPKLLLAIVTLIIGLWLIKVLSKGVFRMMERRNIDPSLKTFLKSLLSILLKIVLIITVIGMVGVEITAFLAIFASIGIGIGMALSGTLQNVAGGIFILFMKPYKLGDFVKIQSEMGTVKAIQVFHTVLKTVDNKTIVVPNALVINGILINYSDEDKRRVDFIFGIDYKDDIDLAKEVIMGLIRTDKRIINEPDPPFVAVNDLGNSSVNLVVRVWVNSPDYWDVYFYLMESVKKAFDANGISIPYPQQDVYVHQVK